MTSAVLPASMFRKGSFGYDAIFSFGGSALARLITLAAAPLITRVYVASDYGVWVALLALSGLLLPIATMRYEIAIVLADTSRLASALVFAILAMSASAAFVTGIFWAMAPASWAETLSGIDIGKQHLLWLAPVILLLIAVQTVQQAWATRDRDFFGLGFSQIAQALVTAVLVLALPTAVGPTAGAAAAAAIAGYVVSIAVLGVRSGPKMLQSMPRSDRIEAARSAAHEYRVYALYAVPYSFSASAVERTLQLVLASSYSLASLGSFFLARQIVMAPAGLLSTSLRQVLFAHGAQDQEPARLVSRTSAILRLLIAVLAPAVAFATFWIEPAATLAFGHTWPDFASYAWWCMIPAAMLLLTGWLDRTLDLKGRQRLAVGMQLISDAVLLGTIALSVVFKWPAETLVAAISIVTAMYNAVWLGVTLTVMGMSRAKIQFIFAKAILTLTVSLLTFQTIKLYVTNLGLPVSAALWLGLTAVFVAIATNNTGIGRNRSGGEA